MIYNDEWINNAKDEFTETKMPKKLRSLQDGDKA